jgi:hypothetical protein
MMGVTAYIEERIAMYHQENGKLPEIVILGKLEWEEIMGCKLDEDWSVASIPVVPDFTRPAGAVVR